MNSQYDEDLQQNPFFQVILEEHKDLLNGASEQSWIICVPRIGTFDRNQLTINDILDHILVPSVDSPDKYFNTLSKKHVTVQNKIITPDQNDFNVSCIQVLFQETFYVENILKYTVWCIDFPFTYSCDSYEIINLINLNSLHDCIDFLWSESSSHEILDQIQKLTQNFLIQHINFETEVLQVQKDLIGGLYSQCLQITIKHPLLRNKINGSSVYLENIKLAVETYMQNCLNNKLFNAICTYLCHDDASFNKIICNNKIHLKKLNITNKILDIIPCTKFYLNKLNKFVTILGKINCLKHAFKALSSHSNKTITSDDLLQIFVYLIFKMNINNWIANLIFIKEFRFSSLDMSDENSFLITNLEAAIQYIKDDLSKSQEEFYSDQNSSQDIIKQFFIEIRNGNLINIKNILENVINVSERNLCHPLCTCDKCKTVCNFTTHLDVNICNENCQTALHVACNYNHLNIVEYLINHGGDVNRKDNMEMIPLHNAASKGHQNILLYLIDKNAFINACDKDGNTPLHYAANNGHDRSVKALVYMPSININISNNMGNTPLHLASKWGYLNIIQILLEAGASTKILNKKNERAQDLAQNYYIYKLLVEANNKINENRIVNIPIKRVAFVDFIQDLKFIPQIKQNNIDYGVRPKTIEQMKKTDLLLKAIECNDLPLTCFYLGLPTATQNVSNINLKGACHPLCVCEHCKILETDTENVKQIEYNTEHVNINTCNANGYTPIHVAAKYGRIEILRLLLDSCAYSNLKTYSTLYTPLHLACLYQRLQIVRELLKCGGCDFDAQDAKGNTPLHYGCSKNHVKIVELLLSHDADCTIKNNRGFTAWHEAQDKMFFDVIKLFEQNSCSKNVDDDDSELFGSS